MKRNEYTEGPRILALFFL